MSGIGSGAAGYRAAAQPVDPAIDQAGADALSRKIQLWIFGPILVLQVLNSLDRVNVSFAALHMNADLGLSRAAYGMGVGIFFWGYLLFQYPSAWLLRKVGFRVWIAAITVLCGLIATGMAFVHHAMSFYVLRFLLGLAEAGFAPGIMSFIRTWVPARRRALTITLTMLSVPISVVIGGPLSGWLMAHANPTGLAGWRWMFLAEAVPLVALGLAALAYFPDTPLTARWLSDAEKARLSAEMAREDEAAASASAATSARGPGALPIVVFAVVWFTMMSGAFSLIFWLPQVVKQLSSHLSDVTIGVVSALPWLCLGAGMVLNSRRSDRRGERFWHVVIPMAVSGAAMGLSALFPSPEIRLLFLLAAAAGLGAGQGAFWAAPAALIRRTGGVGVLVIVNTAGNLGGLVSPPLIGVIRDRTGSFQLPVLCLSVVLLIGAVAMAPLRQALRARA